MPRERDLVLPPRATTVEPAEWDAMAPCEPHEAAWWVKACRKAASRPGDPLGARTLSLGDSSNAALRTTLHRGGRSLFDRVSFESAC
jgi:hypothetical protein